MTRRAIERPALAGIRSSYARYSPDGRKLALFVGGRTDSSIVFANADGMNQVTIVPR
jgi:hypothetical protein